MSKSIQLCVLAAVVTLADLAVFVHCIPILCQAWGTNRWFMSSLFAALFIWAESLANLWRAGTRRLRSSQPAYATPVSLLPARVSEEGSNPNV